MRFSIFDFQVKKDKHANSVVIACLKRLLPVGLNVFGGRWVEICPSFSISVPLNTDSDAHMHISRFLQNWAIHALHFCIKQTQTTNLLGTRNNLLPPVLFDRTHFYTSWCQSALMRAWNLDITLSWGLLFQFVASIQGISFVPSSEQLIFQRARHCTAVQRTFPAKRARGQDQRIHQGIAWNSHQGMESFDNLLPAHFDFFISFRRVFRGQ